MGNFKQTTWSEHGDRLLWSHGRWLFLRQWYFSMWQYDMPSGWRPHQIIAGRLTAGGAAEIDVFVCWWWKLLFKGGLEVEACPLASSKSNHAHHYVSEYACSSWYYPPSSLPELHFNNQPTDMRLIVCIVTNHQPVRQTLQIHWLPLSPSQPENQVLHQWGMM